MLKALGCEVHRTRTFFEAYNELSKDTPAVDLFLIDSILPWGHEDIHAAAEFEGLDTRFGGVLLVRAMRGQTTEQLTKLTKVAGFPPTLPAQYRNTPIVVLSKIADLVTPQLLNIMTCRVIPKAPGIDLTTMKSLLGIA